MNEPATVSVVLPFYNAELYLPEALASIHRQTWQAIDLILVDDGSTDSSARLACNIAPHGRYAAQANRGPASARNLGIAAASSEFIAFLDADDVWLPGKLEQQMRFLAANPQVDAVIGMVEQFVSPDLSPEEAALLQCPAEAMPGYVFGAMLARRDVFDCYGKLPSDLLVGDFASWLMSAQSRGMRCQLLDDVVLRRRLHLTNLSRSKRQARTDFARVMKDHLDRKRRRIA